MNNTSLAVLAFSTLFGLVTGFVAAHLALSGEGEIESATDNESSHPYLAGNPEPGYVVGLESLPSEPTVARLLTSTVQSAWGWASAAINIERYTNSITAMDHVDDLWKQGIRVRRSERETPQSAWEESINEYGTSFDVIGASSLWMKDVLVHGVTDTGASVLEHWKFPEVQGGWFSKAVPASTALGLPAPLLCSSQEYIVGGTYTPMGSRRVPGRPRRASLYRGTSPLIEAAALDLDLRCAFFVGKNPSGLYLISLTSSNPVPVQLLNTTSYPDLAKSEDVHIMQHETLGRCIVVSLQPDDFDTDPSILAIWDFDNNAIPDLVEPFVGEGFYDAYPESQWRYDLVP